jgi:hypothetical protein
LRLWARRYWIFRLWLILRHGCKSTGEVVLLEFSFA